MKQDCDMWKLILVDGNYSPDKNLEAFVSRIDDKRVSYRYNNLDRSMAGNWNFALNVAETDLVCLLHDDDFLEHGYTKHMLKLAKDFPLANGYFCSVNVVSGRGERVFTLADTIKKIIQPKPGNEIILNGDQGLSHLLRGCFIYCPTFLYRKSMLSSSPFNSDWSMVTDLKFYTDILLKDGIIVGDRLKLFNYRRHTNNQTSKLTFSASRFEEELVFYDSLRKTLKTRGWSCSYFHARYKLIIRLHLVVEMIKAILNGDIRRLRKLFRLFFSNTKPS